MELTERLADALVKIWNARDRSQDQRIKGFGVVLSSSPRVTSPRFIIARRPKEEPSYLMREYAIDQSAYEKMCIGRSARLFTMESESWGAELLDPLRDEVALLQGMRRGELGVAGLRIARERANFGRRALFVWRANPDDAESTRRDAAALNEPAQLEAWHF